MVEYSVCPKCNTYFPTPSGQAKICPSCSTVLSQGDKPGGSGPAPNVTILAESQPKIQYVCPRCRNTLESPASFAGQKVNCPHCGQRLQIPSAPASQQPAVNRTILAESVSGAAKPSGGIDSFQAGSPPGGPSPIPPPSHVHRASGKVETCLECGKDISFQERVQTCPDCGAIFCSAHCYRSHQAHAHSKEERQPSRRPYMEPHRGALILTLAIIGLLICGPLNIVAWVMASSDLQKMRHGTMDPEGTGLTQAGMAVAIIGTVLWILGLILMAIASA